MICRAENCTPGITFTTPVGTGDFYTTGVTFIAPVGSADFYTTGVTFQKRWRLAQGLFHLLCRRGRQFVLLRSVL